MKITELVIKKEEFETKPEKQTHIKDNIYEIGFSKIDNYIKWLKENINCIVWEEA